MLSLLIPADREIVHHFGELEGFGLAAVQDGGGDVGREFRQADDFAGVTAGDALPLGHVADGAGLAGFDHLLPCVGAHDRLYQGIVKIGVAAADNILTVRRGDDLALVPFAEVDGDLHHHRLVHVRILAILETQFRHQLVQHRGKAGRMENNDEFCRMDRHFVDQKADDPRLFHREQILPHPVEILQHRLDVRQRDGKVFLGFQDLAEPFGVGQDPAHVIENNVLQQRRRYGFERAFAIAFFDGLRADVIAVEIILFAGEGRRHGIAVGVFQYAFEQIRPILMGFPFAFPQVRFSLSSRI